MEMKFELFEKLMTLAKEMWEFDDALQDVLQCDETEVTYMTDKILDIIRESMGDVGGDYSDPVTTCYILEQKWGTIPEVWHLEDKEYVINNLESLYNYLSDVKSHKVNQED